MEVCEVPDLKTLASHTDVSYSTLTRLWKNPEDFRASTLSAIFDYLTMPREERGVL